MSRHRTLQRWGGILIWGLTLLVSSAFGVDQIYIRESFLRIERDSSFWHNLPDNAIEIGLECAEPVAAIQFTLAPIAPGVELLPLVTFPYADWCAEQAYWYYQAENTLEGGLRVILIDTLLRGMQINPHGEFYTFCKIECRIDSSASIGIFPVRISDVQACDTNGNLLVLAQKDGRVAVSDGEALLYAPPDTLIAGAPSYTWTLYELNSFPVAIIWLGIRPPTPHFHLQNISTNLFDDEFMKKWSQDTTGLIRVGFESIGPLKLRPCVWEKEIVTINLHFQVDTSLSAGVYQFSLEKFVAWDCTDNFILSDAAYLAPLSVAASSPVKSTPISLPQNWCLGPIFPNPSNATTTISYDVPQTENVSIEVYDLKGRRVAQLVKHVHAPGHYQCQWQGRDYTGQTVASGVYLVRMSVGERVLTQKMLFLK